MGFAESLRAVAGSFGGLQDDYYEYDDYDDAGEDVRDEVDETERGEAPRRRDRGAGASYDEIYREEAYRRSRPTGRRPAGGWPADEQSARPLALVHPPRMEFVLVAPRDFEAAQRIADILKGGSPVIVDLQPCDRDLSNRLIDFCSGLTYAVEGGLQFIGENAVLLSPRNVDPSSDEPGGLQERPFYNQA